MSRSPEPANLPTGDDSPEPAGAAADIFPQKSYAPAPRVRRRFMPWHKPRKHYVREYQWAAEVDWLLSKRPPNDRTPLRYLGLPGADLLDIRHLYQRFCADGQRELVFLGFDESAKPGSSSREALNVSLDEVRRLAYVDDQSDILGDDFRNLAKDDSIAWDRAKALGPFDVINLDLCGHIGTDPPDIDISIYNAVHQMCGLQNRHSRPWSLFITSRITRQSFSPQVLRLLLRQVRRNVASCPEFSQALEDLCGKLTYSEEAMAALGDEDYFLVAIVMIVKWLLGLAQTMNCKFGLTSITAYRVYGGAASTDMLSLVLRFEPIPRIASDPSGLASSSPALLDECSQAAQIPRAIDERIDIDALLASDGELQASMVDSSADLLRQARYDVEKYRDWVSQGSSQGLSNA